MIEVIIWVALTLAAPPAARLVRLRLGERLAGWETEAALWSRAAYGVLPLYAAWVSGAVIGRDCGITGLSPAAWLKGFLICLLLLMAFAFGLRWTAWKGFVTAWFLPGSPWVGLFDEPRWAFYRGAAAVPFPDPLMAQVAGLALGGLEWLISHGRPRRGTPASVWSGLVRLGVSAVVFALTHNLWLTLMTQAAAQALVLRSRAVSPAQG